MTDREIYYDQGFLQKEFTSSESLQRVQQIIHDLGQGQIRPGFYMEEKYRLSKDLRPSVLDYDEAFLNLLADNHIPKLLKDLIGTAYVLSHIQLRVSFPGKSYMDWHRDTYKYADNFVGNVPPVHKIIYYPPAEDNTFSPRLKVIPRSHRMQIDNRRFDLLQTKFRKSAVIEDHHTNFLIFNTSLWHAVIPEKFSRGSWRLIYSFCQDFQLPDHELEQRTAAQYRQLCINATSS